MENQKMKHVGTWGNHKQANPNENFQAEIKCGVCFKSFKVTLIENIEKEEVLIWLESQEKPKGWFVFTRYFQKKFREQAMQYNSVCPNCGYKKELFCVPYKPKKIIESEWERIYYD